MKNCEQAIMNNNEKQVECKFETLGGQYNTDNSNQGYTSNSIISQSNETFNISEFIASKIEKSFNQENPNDNKKSLFNTLDTGNILKPEKQHRKIIAKTVFPLASYSSKSFTNDTLNLHCSENFSESLIYNNSKEKMAREFSTETNYKNAVSLSETTNYRQIMPNYNSFPATNTSSNQFAKMNVLSFGKRNSNPQASDISSITNSAIRLNSPNSLIGLNAREFQQLLLLNNPQLQKQFAIPQHFINNIMSGNVLTSQSSSYYNNNIKSGEMEGTTNYSLSNNNNNTLGNFPPNGFALATNSNFEATDNNDTKIMANISNNPKHMINNNNMLSQLQHLTNINNSLNNNKDSTMSPVNTVGNLQQIMHQLLTQQPIQAANLDLIQQLGNRSGPLHPNFNAQSLILTPVEKSPSFPTPHSGVFNNQMASQFSAHSSFNPTFTHINNNSSSSNNQNHPNNIINLQNQLIAVAALTNNHNNLLNTSAASFQGFIPPSGTMTTPANTYNHSNSASSTPRLGTSNNLADNYGTPLVRPNSIGSLSNPSALHLKSTPQPSSSHFNVALAGHLGQAIHKPLSQQSLPTGRQQLLASGPLYNSSQLVSPHTTPHKTFLPSSATNHQSYYHTGPADNVHFLMASAANANRKKQPRKQNLNNLAQLAAKRGPAGHHHNDALFPGVLDDESGNLNGLGLSMNVNVPSSGKVNKMQGLSSNSHHGNSSKTNVGLNIANNSISQLDGYQGSHNKNLTSHKRNAIDALNSTVKGTGLPGSYLGNSPGGKKIRLNNVIHSTSLNNDIERLQLPPSLGGGSRLALSSAKKIRKHDFIAGPSNSLATQPTPKKRGAPPKAFRPTSIGLNYTNVKAGSNYINNSHPNAKSSKSNYLDTHALKLSRLENSLNGEHDPLKSYDVSMVSSKKRKYERRLPNETSQQNHSNRSVASNKKITPSSKTKNIEELTVTVKEEIVKVKPEPSEESNLTVTSVTNKAKKQPEEPEFYLDEQGVRWRILEEDDLSFRHTNNGSSGAPGIMDTCSYYYNYYNFAASNGNIAPPHHFVKADDIVVSGSAAVRTTNLTTGRTSKYYDPYGSGGPSTNHKLTSASNNVYSLHYPNSYKDYPRDGYNYSGSGTSTPLGDANALDFALNFYLGNNTNYNENSTGDAGNKTRNLSLTQNRESLETNQNNHPPYPSQSWKVIYFLGQLDDILNNSITHLTYLQTLKEKLYTQKLAHKIYPSTPHSIKSGPIPLKTLNTNYSNKTQSHSFLSSFKTFQPGLIANNSRSPRLNMPISDKPNSIVVEQTPNFSSEFNPNRNIKKPTNLNPKKNVSSHRLFKHISHHRPKPFNYLYFQYYVSHCRTDPDVVLFEKLLANAQRSQTLLAELYDVHRHLRHSYGAVHEALVRDGVLNLFHYTINNYHGVASTLLLTRSPLKTPSAANLTPHFAYSAAASTTTSIIAKGSSLTTTQTCPDDLFTKIICPTPNYFTALVKKVFAASLALSTPKR